MTLTGQRQIYRDFKYEDVGFTVVAEIQNGKIHKMHISHENGISLVVGNTEEAEGVSDVLRRLSHKVRVELATQRRMLAAARARQRGRR